MDKFVIITIVKKHINVKATNSTILPYSQKWTKFLFML
jgi:hypothetical protein